MPRLLIKSALSFSTHSSCIKVLNTSYKKHASDRLIFSSYSRPSPPALAAALLKAHPEPMMTAILMHNDLIQKARADNFGHVIEQEGDSFCIAFSDSYDAVKFCLQVRDLSILGDLSVCNLISSSCCYFRYNKCLQHIHGRRVCFQRNRRTDITMGRAVTALARL